MLPTSSLAHFLTLFLLSVAAKGRPCAPKGNTKDPKASHFEATLRYFFATFLFRPQIKSQGFPKWLPQAQNDPKDVLKTSKIRQNCFENPTTHAKD